MMATKTKEDDLLSLDAPVTGGNNPLLARIVAAQEKAKQVGAVAVSETQTSQMSAAPADFDLLGVGTSSPPVADAQVAAPPVSSPEEEMIMGLEGLSPEERKTLIDEQRKIMQQIEEEKTANEAAIVSASADAFDQRSNTYVANVAGGGATTRAHTSTGGGTDDLSRAQLDEDAQLAERLQAEEYARGESRQVSRSNVAPPVSSQNESMWDTITSIFSVDPMSENLRPSIQDTRGVTRPPGGGTGRGVQAESQGLLASGGGNSSGRAPARVAQSNSNIFACVADGAASAIASVGTALNAQTLAKDGEGNVHGVDSSSLLSMSSPPRNGGASYTSLPSDA